MNDQRELTNLLEAVESGREEIDVERITGFLESDRGEVRNTALKVLYHITRDDPDRVAPVADDVIDRLTDPYLVARSMAAMTLVPLARERPDAVEPALPDLIDLLDEDLPVLRFRAAGAIAPLSGSHAEAFVEHVDELVDHLGDAGKSGEYEQLLDVDDPSSIDYRTRQDLVQEIADERAKDQARSKGTREVIANTLVEIARVAPDACAGWIPDLVSVIENGDSTVRGPTIDVVRYVAESDPNAVEPAINVLIERLDDDVNVVRARAIRALGFAEATNAVGPLRSAAESDPDDDVAELAAETARWLADHR